MQRDFQKPGRSIVYAANGICATSHPHAARTAVEIMRAGGNAVDAGVAAAMVLNIGEPAMTGLGGDCFALWKPANGPLVALNGSGRAPAAIDAEALRAKHPGGIPKGSVDAITVPGAIAGLCRLQADHGRLGRDAVFAPGIAAAEDGIPVAPRVAWDWASEGENLQGHGRRHFLKNGETPYAAGDIFRNPGNAEVLRLIVEKGPAGFYEGPVAEDLVATLQSLGGAHTLDDFAGVEPEYVDAISTPYRGYDVTVPPPNGHGATALLILDMLTALDRRGVRLADYAPTSAERAHIETEVSKLAYDAAWRFMGEPSTIGGGLTHMRAPATAEALAALVDLRRACPPAEVRQTAAAAHQKETIYLTAVDPDGGALSLIYSVFDSFGSGFASERYGVPFHNRGAGFTLEAGHPNEIGPGKRPLHTIIPGMLLKNGRAEMPYGVMGGVYQPTGHARLLTNVLDYDLDPQTAIDLPRTRLEGGGTRFNFGALGVERGYSTDVFNRLTALGHAPAWREGPAGGAQAIQIDWDRGVLIGASDPRKDGCAIGW